MNPCACPVHAVCPFFVGVPPPCLTAGLCADRTLVVAVHVCMHAMACVHMRVRVQHVDGRKMTDEMAKFVKERIALEESYAKGLEKLSQSCTWRLL